LEDILNLQSVKQKIYVWTAHNLITRLH